MNKIGAKTQRLQELQELGFNVPKFYVIAARAQWDSAGLQKECEAAHKSLKASRYAVRSSALIEDSSTESYAGQFKTVLDVTPDALAGAIQEVLDQAEEFLKGHLEKFSILVQEFIEPDTAGVAFTRSPSGERQMVLEYFRGRGEDLVSGKIKPDQFQLYWSSKAPELFPGLQKLWRQFKEIEKHYGHPQDIEWCVKDGQAYILQTRPITTVSPEDYQGILYLEKTLPKGDFYFEKTEISEIAPRPTSATFELLQNIYAQGGPVDRVYRKNGIHYENRPFLKLIGGELYVDKEEELHTLLPSYSYFPSTDLKPRVRHFKGLFRSLKNSFARPSLSGGTYEALLRKLETALLDEKKFVDFSEWQKAFLLDYETVFEINLLAGKALQRFIGLIRKEKLDLAALLTGSEEFSHVIQTKPFRGNSLDFSDESPFMRTKASSLSYKEEWGKLSPFKQKAYSPSLKILQSFMSLREWGRWLVVKRISQGRELLTQKQKQAAKISPWTFPKRLSSVLLESGSQFLGVSAGVAEGVLRTKESLSGHEKVILFTKILSPDLVQYFDRIEGIVSEEGGLLSHLAIVAREKGIPVLICPSLYKAGVQVGDRVKMDATMGTLVKA